MVWFLIFTTKGRYLIPNLEKFTYMDDVQFAD